MPVCRLIYNDTKPFCSSTHRVTIRNQEQGQSKDRPKAVPDAKASSFLVFLYQSDNATLSRAYRGPTGAARRSCGVANEDWQDACFDFSVSPDTVMPSVNYAYTFLHRRNVYNVMVLRISTSLKVSCSNLN